MAKDPDEPKLLDKKVDFTLGSAEPPDVRQSRLRRVEEDATHTINLNARRTRRPTSVGFR
ncbi:hypothetical protein [Singulisphaera sp. GP187]|uniref:hypothetical protein n=1 Tax=Singulisphaera sp. GP187 TaxID=1882752 RepID=UPI0020B17532|nr:hypothetical protein [Singulisphaera sp. GP187]